MCHSAVAGTCPNLSHHPPVRPGDGARSFWEWARLHSNATVHHLDVQKKKPFKRAAGTALPSVACMWGTDGQTCRSKERRTSCFLKVASPATPPVQKINNWWLLLNRAKLMHLFVELAAAVSESENPSLFCSNYTLMLILRRDCANFQENLRKKVKLQVQAKGRKE